jgi:hypothetical protein
MTPPAARFIWRFEARDRVSELHVSGRRTGGITPYAAIQAQTFSELDVNNGGFTLACATRRMTAGWG